MVCLNTVGILGLFRAAGALRGEAGEDVKKAKR